MIVVPILVDIQLINLKGIIMFFKGTRFYGRAIDTLTSLGLVTLEQSAEFILVYKMNLAVKSAIKQGLLLNEYDCVPYITVLIDTHIQSITVDEFNMVKDWITRNDSEIRESVKYAFNTHFKELSD